MGGGGSWGGILGIGVLATRFCLFVCFFLKNEDGIGKIIRFMVCSIENALRRS